MQFSTIGELRRHFAIAGLAPTRGRPCSIELVLTGWQHAAYLASGDMAGQISGVIAK